MQPIFLPNPTASKMVAYGVYGRRDRTDRDQTMVIGIRLPLMEQDLLLLVLKSETLADIFATVLNRVGGHPLFRNVTGVFCTADEAGWISPGRLSDLASEKLQDGQLLFLHYGLYTRGFWKKPFLPRPVKGRPCHHCSDQPGSITVISGFRSFVICLACFEASRVHRLTCSKPNCRCPKTAAKYSYICTNCGANGAGLQYGAEANSQVATCTGQCREQPVNRICRHCEVPTDQTLNCGRCRKVRYCSKDCQRADWKQRHKLECDPPIEKEES